MFEDGAKVKIGDKAFNVLTHLNGQVGKVCGAGKSGKTVAVDLVSGGRCYVDPKDLQPA